MSVFMGYAVLNDEGYCDSVISTSMEIPNANGNYVKIYNDILSDYMLRCYDKNNNVWLNKYHKREDKIYDISPIRLEDVKTDTSKINTTTTMTSEDALLLMEMMLDIQKQLAKLNPTV